MDQQYNYYPMYIPDEQFIEFQKWHQYQLMMYQMNLYYNTVQYQPYMINGMFPGNQYIEEGVGDTIVAESEIKSESGKADEKLTTTVVEEEKIKDYPLIKPIYINASELENTKNIHEPGIIIDIGTDFFKTNYKILKRVLDEQIEHLTSTMGQLVPGAQLFYWYFPKELRLLDLLVIRDTKKEGYREEYGFRIIGKMPINKKLPELSLYSDYCAICKWF